MTQKNIDNSQCYRKNVTTWVIVEPNLRGTENQCLGIATALGLTPVIKYIRLRFPWKQLSPLFRFCPEKSVCEPQDFFTTPLPDIVIAAGRKAVIAALAIKKRSQGRTFVIFLQDPKVSTHHFDIVVAPAHDNVTGDNVIQTICGLHNVTPEKIEEHKQIFEKQYHHLPKPRIGVLIGGTSKTHTLTESATITLAQDLMRLAEKGYGVMVTASRRTGQRNLDILKQILNISRVHLYTGDGMNPYFGILAWADILLVTEDSVSMTSEAISTGKPVYIIPMKGTSTKFNRFHKKLRDLGITRLFQGDITTWEYESLDEMKEVAEKIAIPLGEKFKIE